LCLLTGLATLGMADETKKSADPKEKAITPKGETRHLAAAINFNKELGLEFDSLKTLGTRIDQARSAPDPVGLLGAAQELAAAEKASGKHSTLTAETLTKEAVDLARLRSNSKELKAAAALVHDEKTAKDLESEASKAEKREADQAKAFKSGEKTRGTDVLRVVNETPYYAYVYVNGTLVATTPPYTQADYLIFMKYDTVVLTAAVGGVVYGPDVITGNYDLFRYTLR